MNLKEAILLCLLALGVNAHAQDVHYKGEVKDLSFVKENPKLAIYDLSALEAAHAVGGNIVGISTGSIPSHLSELSTKANIGGLTKPDVKAVATLAPDLIIISGRQRSKLDSLAQIAPVIELGLNNANYLESLYNQVETMGKITGKQENAKKVVSDLKEKITELQAIAKQKNSDDAVMIMYMKGKYLGFPSQSRFGFVYDVLGFKESNIPMDASARSNPIDEQTLAKANPAYIFLFDRSELHGDKLANKETIETEGFKQTKAYKNGNVAYLTPSLWYLIGGGVYSTELMANEVLGIQ